MGVNSTMDKRLVRRGDGEGVQLVERWRFEPRLRQEHKKKIEIFPPRVKNVVLNRCRCAQPTCVHARIIIITNAR